MKPTWKEQQDTHDQMKRTLEETRDESLVVTNLKKQGNIKEAAAVFSYEGFNFLLESLGSIVADKVSEMIDQKIHQALEGFNDGMKQAVHASVNPMIANELEKQLGATDKPEKEAEIEEKISEPRVGKIALAPKKAEASLSEKDEYTFTGFEIPRSKTGRINWKYLLTDIDHLEQVFLHYMMKAEQVFGPSFTSKQFRKAAVDSDAVYQRISILANTEKTKTYEQLHELYTEKYQTTSDDENDEEVRTISEYENEGDSVNEH